MTRRAAAVRYISNVVSIAAFDRIDRPRAVAYDHEQRDTQDNADDWPKVISKDKECLPKYQSNTRKNAGHDYREEGDELSDLRPQTEQQIRRHYRVSGVR